MHATALKDFTSNNLLKKALNFHRQGQEPNIFLFATPRGGSTWLLEMLWSQPGFKSCSEPLNLRDPIVRRHLGTGSWSDIYSRTSTTRLEPYFRAFCEGRLHITEPLPLRGRYHRLFTNRIVFKMLHGGEDNIDWFARTFNGRPLLLLRHPVPVSLSRKQLPRLNTFLESDYVRHFTKSEQRLAKQVVTDGTDLERGVLDWCLQTAVPLRQATSALTIVTYEQLVAQPRVVVSHLASRLSLPKPEIMLQHINRASSVSYQSDIETRHLLGTASSKESRVRLVEKWRDRIDAGDERRVRDLLEGFKIDAYRADSAWPADGYWLDER